MIIWARCFTGLVYFTLVETGGVPNFTDNEADARTDTASCPRARTLVEEPKTVSALMCRGSWKCLLKGSGDRALREGNVEEVGTRASGQMFGMSSETGEKPSLAGEKGDWGHEDGQRQGADLPSFHMVGC